MKGSRGSPLLKKKKKKKKLNETRISPYKISNSVFSGGCDAAKYQNVLCQCFPNTNI